MHVIGKRYIISIYCKYSPEVALAGSTREQQLLRGVLEMHKSAACYEHLFSQSAVGEWRFAESVSGPVLAQQHLAGSHLHAAGRRFWHSFFFFFFKLPLSGRVPFIPTGASHLNELLR